MIGNNFLPITNYQLPITNSPLPITNSPLPITHYQLPITNYPLPITPLKSSAAHNVIKTFFPENALAILAQALATNGRAIVFSTRCR
ncbi:hypothetical protein H6F62_10010 [Anabaena sp. FACHB-1391]|uniref:hypothetical protein n=1 Tax=Anabaena sp. FACHB-1391 TaxID=2692771 RepID=UPI001680E9F0|nr:hypothetical protein [Anabaena sp. FACHB-1391]MBD2269087.1 hypothetical protein [Anabaena sp. FACHB-1391]